jgi:hypothetical protein
MAGIIAFVQIVAASDGGLIDIESNLPCRLLAQPGH